MNRTPIDKEIYPLLASFLAEVHAYSTNRKEIMDLHYMKYDPDSDEEYRGNSPYLTLTYDLEQSLVMMDMKRLSRTKILEKYYTLILVLDPAKHSYLIEHLKQLYVCISKAMYDEDVKVEVDWVIENIIDDISRLK